MTFSPGYKIGAYTVVRPLGQGGMGDVYEVVHEQLGTHYALKAFSCDYEEAEALQKKFFEEGRLLSKLTHPRIVRVFDLAIEPKSQMPYFVMDLVLYEDGESHTVEDVEKSDITENLVYLWFKDVAEALDYIHSQGIVHRDVKPSNLLLNSDYHVTLTDFGVSRIFGEKIVHEVDASRTMASKTGRGKLVLGTEHYIAPEVAQGEEATPAADAYALGMMCFRLLTGVWYEPDSDALSLLAKFKLRWMAVLPQLLSPHAEKRPKELYRLKEHLKGTAQPPVKVQSKNKTRPHMKFDLVRFGITTFFAVAFVAGALWLGYQGFLKYDADRKSQADRMNAELKRQIAEQKEASQKIAAEQQRLRDEAARQKAEAEKIAEAKRKREAEEREKEARRITIGKQENAEVKKPSVKPSAAPVPKEKKDEFVLLGNEVEKPAKDYGPIPNKTYTWLKGGNAALPQEVKFQLSNGAVIDLVPLKAATFYMSNDWRDGRTHHKVTLTRPFWMSKYLLTAAQCRDFAPNDYEDCRPIEKALADTPYTVSVRMNRRQIDAFCKFLSEKYRAQLPKGYVFRLPTEAEWEYAYDEEGTERLYEDKGSWWQVVLFSNRNGIETMRRLRKEKGLDKICAWRDETNWSGCFTSDHRYFVGGRMQPFASGIHDLNLEVTMCLDVVDGKMRTSSMAPKRFLAYDENVVDPLRWVSDVDIYSAAQFIKREWGWKRWTWPMNAGPQHSHIVLGPDLIAERVWETCRRDEPRRARKGDLKMFPAKWIPTASPRKLNSERKYSFALDNGVRMDFCLCPAGKFNMSNIDGDVRRSHKVILTSPFLVSKFNVTAAQWRDFGPHDCEGVAREMEALFKKEKYPICVRRNYIQWTKFCEYLTEHYKAILPKGYVFRLPTEAELEWAMVADENGDVRNLGDQFDDALPGYREAMVRLLGKKHFPDVKHFDTAGFYRECYIGGRSSANVWGMCDFRLDKMCLDLMDADRRIDPSKIDSREKDGGAGIEREWAYREEEIDPVRWHGRRGWYFVRRWWRSERRLWPMHDTSFAHIVIAPDILADLKRFEEADYPLEDFGGVFLGGKAKVVDVSTGHSWPFNSPQGWDRLLSRENVIVREKDYDEDWRGCHTDKELTPWVQIELDPCRTITGLQIESFRLWHLARHLRVWVSDGSKEMRLVAQEDRQLQRYRFDLRGQDVKAKFIRIGREPGFTEDHFCLNKVLIYGK